MSPEASNGHYHVVVVGGGFAGVGCVRELAKHEHVRVTLIDRLGARVREAVEVTA